MPISIDAIRFYLQMIKRIVGSAWKLLIINALLLFMIVGILIFTHAQMHKNYYISDAILNGFVFYFAMFPCFKALIHHIGLSICKTRLSLYKMQMAEIISEPDYETYLKRPLRKIQVIFLTYPLVILMHLSMAYICYHLKYF